MDKLIITVTCDSKMSFPGNPHCPDPSDTKAVADEYIPHCARGGQSNSVARGGTPDDRTARKNRSYRVAPIPVFHRT